MRNDELVRKISNASEMVFSVNGKRFTVCDEEEKGFSIAQWNRPDTERYFASAEDLVNEYQIDGKPVKEWAESIRIEDYTGFDA